MKYGYYHERIAEVDNRHMINLLQKEHVDAIICEENVNKIGQEQYEKLNEAISMLKPGDTLVVPTIRDLRKTVIQLAAFLNILERQDIHFLVIDRDAEINMEDYSVLIHKFAEMEKNLIRHRTSSGLKRARKEGRVGGRPRISQETIDRIQFLYNTDKYSLREIADQCDISLGTAYKYVQLKHEPKDF